MSRERWRYSPYLLNINDHKVAGYAAGAYDSWRGVFEYEGQWYMITREDASDLLAHPIAAKYNEEAMVVADALVRLS